MAPWRHSIWVLCSLEKIRVPFASWQLLGIASFCKIGCADVYLSIYLSSVDACWGRGESKEGDGARNVSGFRCKVGLMFQLWGAIKGGLEVRIAEGIRIYCGRLEWNSTCSQIQQQIDTVLMSQRNLYSYPRLRLYSRAAVGRSGTTRSDLFSYSRSNLSSKISLSGSAFWLVRAGVASLTLLSVSLLAILRLGGFGMKTKRCGPSVR